MRVLGVDPGTLKMGVGLVDSEGGELVMVHASTLSPSASDSLADRLHHLYVRLLDLIEVYHPSVVAVEEPFVAKNPRAALAVGQAQAVAMVAASHQGLETFMYAPSQVKRSVTDYGASSKGQVHEMVRVLLRLPDDWEQSPDASDALAVAICHLAASRVQELVPGG